MSSDKHGRWWRDPQAYERACDAFSERDVEAVIRTASHEVRRYKSGAVEVIDKRYASRIVVDR